MPRLKSHAASICLPGGHALPAVQTNTEEVDAATVLAVDRQRPGHAEAMCSPEHVPWLAWAVRTIFRVWPDRHRQRRALRELDSDRLHDLGISRSEAMRESRKPFWR